MISVLLDPNGAITQMDEALLVRRDEHVETDVESTDVVEYWHPDIPDRAVHRSVHVRLKQGISGETVLGRLG